MDNKGHEYLSTSCLHGEHAYCQASMGDNGDEMWHKRPAQCKFCHALCVCPCHGETARG